MKGKFLKNRTIQNTLIKSILAAVVIFVFTLPSFAFAFDGSQSNWAEGELQEAIGDGLTYSQIENNYKNQITREEFCTIAVKLYEKLTGGPAMAAEDPFDDTDNSEVLKAYNIGIVNGTSANMFSPYKNITRQEICVMIYRTLKAANPSLSSGSAAEFPFGDVGKIATWAGDAMRFCYGNNIMKGTSATTIDPLSNTTREQAIVLVKRTHDGFTGTTVVTPTPSPTPTPTSVPAASITISNASLPDGSKGVAYTAVLTATGSSGIYSWSAAGLPAGISLSSVGLLSGKSDTAGTYQVAITVADNMGLSTTKTLSLKIKDVTALVITTTTLPGGAVGSDYSATIKAAGGSGTYTWSATGLPGGLSVSKSINKFILIKSFSSMDGYGNSSYQNALAALSLEIIDITPKLELLVPTMPKFELNYSILNSWVISGKPTVKGTNVVTITADDGAGQTASMTLPLEIAASTSNPYALTIGDSNLAGVGYLGFGYNVITGKYADPVSLSEGQILDIYKLLSAGKVVKMPVSSSEDQYMEGHSALSYAESFSQHVGLSGGYMFFKGSASVNFSNSSLSQSDYSFATLMYKTTLYKLYLDSGTNLGDYLTTSFKNDVNNMEPYELFSRYGTHVLKSIQMGGHIDYNVAASSAYDKSTYSLEADVKASFNAGFASASVHTNSQYSETSESFNSSTSTTIRATPMYESVDFNPDKFDVWIQSVKQNPGLSDFGDNALVPISQFASTPARRTLLEQAYAAYAADNSVIAGTQQFGIAEIRLSKYTVQNRGSAPSQYSDSAGDWYLVSNLAASPSSSGEQTMVYVRYATTKEPIVGIFFANETQGENAYDLFEAEYLNGDSTAKLWGYGHNSNTSSGLDNYINNDMSSKSAMHMYYVTSQQKKAISFIRIGWTNLNGETSYAYAANDSTQAGRSYGAVIDLGTKYYLGNSGIRQNCNEGLEGYSTFPFLWYTNHWVEYTTD